MYLDIFLSKPFPPPPHLCYVLKGNLSLHPALKLVNKRDFDRLRGNNLEYDLCCYKKCSCNSGASVYFADLCSSRILWQWNDCKKSWTCAKMVAVLVLVRNKVILYFSANSIKDFTGRFCPVSSRSKRILQLLTLFDCAFLHLALIALYRCRIS